MVAEGDSLTVQPIGTPGLLVVKNYGFQAPGLPRDRPGDRLHDRSRRLPATARSSPARRSGSTTRSRSAATRSTRTASGRRRTSDQRRAAAGRSGTARSPLTDTAAGLPYGTMSRARPRRRPEHAPATRRPTATGVLLVLPYRATGTSSATARPTIEELDPVVAARSARLRRRRRTRTSRSGSRRLRRVRRSSSPRRTRARGSSGRRSPPDRRARDHVLPAAPADLGPARARRASSRSSAGPIATSTSSASSAACSTTSWRARRARGPRRSARGGPDASRPADGDACDDVRDAVFPSARRLEPAGLGPPTARRSTRDLAGSA